jgi:Protein of unknown function (DUF2637)
VELKKVLAGIAVVAVAIIAAVVSFNHIDTLALSHGYSYFTAALLPFSVDSLIVAASLSLMAAIRPALSRFGIGLGVTATLAANVAYGVHFGVVGALVGAWPAVAFIVAAEILVGMLRARPATETVPVSVPEPVMTVPEVLPVDTPESASPEVLPESTPKPMPRSTPKSKTKSASGRSPEKVFATEIEAGTLPSVRRVQRELGLGFERAKTVHAQLQESIAN